MGKSSLVPGFRFYPTDVELVMYHLKRKLLGKRLIIQAIAEVNIYNFSPWDLPDKSNLRNGDLEWFFFCPKSKKYLSGSRMNRATGTGYWKATGKDRPVEYKQRTVAMIKTLVFHLGHPPKGQRTDWVMHEYRMEDKDLANAGVVQDAYVICRLFKKSGSGPKNGAQYGAPYEEEEWDDDDGLSEATETLNHNVNSLATTNMTLTDPGPSTANMTLTDPGPSTITSSANERHVDVPTNDDAMVTHEDITSIFEGSSRTINGNDNPQVEDPKGKKVMTATPNEDDGIFKDLASLSNLDDLSEDAFNMFSVDGSDYMLDTFPADDLDVDLGRFFVG